MECFGIEEKVCNIPISLRNLSFSFLSFLLLTESTHVLYMYVDR